MPDTLRIKLDFDNTETADDGDTSHYGGEYSIDGQTFRAWGDDRSDSWHAEAAEKIVDKIQAKWPSFKECQDTAQNEDQRAAQAYVDRQGPAPTYKYIDIDIDVVIEVTNKRTMRATLIVTRAKDGTFSVKLGRYSK